MEGRDTRGHCVTTFAVLVHVAARNDESVPGLIGKPSATAEATSLKARSGPLARRSQKGRTPDSARRARPQGSGEPFRG